MAKSNTYLKRLWFDVKHLRTRNKLFVFGGLIILIIGGFVLGQTSSKKVENEELATEKVSNVQIVSVREVSQDLEPLRLLGNVSSRSVANIRTEAQGQVTRVYVTEGQRVQRGQTIATIENSSQRAALAQVKASLAAAGASIDRSQTLTGVNLESAIRGLEETRSAALNTLNTALIQVDDAVRGQADLLFDNADTSNPQLIFIVSSNQQSKESLERTRRDIGRLLADWNNYVNSINEEQLSVENIDIVEEYIEEVRSFLSELVSATSNVQSSESISTSQIAAWKATATAARSIVNGVLAGLTPIRTSLIQAESGLQIAKEEQNQSSLGSNTTARATVTQAESALVSAEINLAKTIIKAPITGVVSSLNIENGDFVSMLQPVAEVSNDTNLEILTYVTEVERNVIKTGSGVYIGDFRSPGVVNRVAPTIDSDTQKIEVSILPDNQEELIDGQSVQVSIERTEQDPDQILVPLSSLKVLTEGFSVLTVVDNQIESLSVKVGPVVGNRVLIYEGLELDTLIIKDVRGLKIGDSVEINN